MKNTLSEREKDFARHCVELLKNRNQYDDKQWSEAIYQLEMAAGIHRIKPRKSSYLDLTQPKDREE